MPISALLTFIKIAASSNRGVFIVLTQEKEYTNLFYFFSFIRKEKVKRVQNGLKRLMTKSLSNTYIDRVRRILDKM